MGYALIGEAAMLLHFAFLAYVAVGGFLAWRWPAAFWPHLVCAAYGLGIVVIGWTCPLTVVENWARIRAGEEGLPEEGFISHYLTGVVYPEDDLVAARIAVAAAIALSWAGAALLTWGPISRKRRGKKQSPR